MKKALTIVCASLLATGLSFGQSLVGDRPDSASTSAMMIRSVRRAAPSIPIAEASVIKSYYIELPFNKTVSIIFNSPVRSVDLGSRFIIADKAADVENVLKVKASVMGFNETNFSVITADGKFWSFVASYNETPAILALNLAYSPTLNALVSRPPVETPEATPTVKHRKRDKTQVVLVSKTEGVSPAVNQIPSFDLAGRTDYLNGLDSQEGTIVFSGVRATQNEVVTNCEKILKKRRNVRHLGVEKDLMEASVRGVFVKDNVFYYRVTLTNKSNLNYDVDFVRFFVIDKTIAKLTSRQETEIVPFYVYHDEQKTIQGNSVVERVYTFQKFTIPDNKRLVVMAGEVNGGRNLSFGINNSDIMDADKLN